jgi:hypothetical protein
MGLDGVFPRSARFIHSCWNERQESIPVVIVWQHDVSKRWLQMENTPEPKLQTETSGGDGSGGKTRIGAGTPGDSGGPKRVHLDGPLTVKELAQKMHINETKIVQHLFKLREPRTVNQIVELDLAQQTALAMGYELV